MYKGTFSTILLLYFSFSNWKQGITGWTTLSSPGAPLVVMATTCGATGGIWGCWLCGLRFSLVFSARLIWHLHPIYRDNHVTEMQTMLCILVLLCLKFFFIFIFFIIAWTLFWIWKQGIVIMTTLASLVAPWVVITTTCVAIGDGGLVGLMGLYFQCSMYQFLMPYLCFKPK